MGKNVLYVNTDGRGVKPVPHGEDKAWTKIYSHDITAGPFANLEEAKKKNVDDENAKLYSKLYDLESMRDKDGVFHFKLCYPDRTEVTFRCNEWKQSSNPVTEPKVTGFEPIRLTWPLRADHQPFSGLMSSTPDKNLIDDTEGTPWANSIGTIQPLQDKIPGPVGEDRNIIPVSRNVLYVNINHQEVITEPVPSGPGEDTVWTKIYSHDITAGPFANLEEAKKKNVDDENAKLYSKLYDLESM